jgi:hypothetical protein
MAEFDTLASVLFEGEIRASDIKTMPGTSAEGSRDHLSGALLDSMKRVGLIVDGKLVNKIGPKY